MKVKTDIEVWEGNVLIRGHETGFSLEVTSDPEQHGKSLHFYAQSAGTLLRAVQDYIRARDVIQELNFPSPVEKK